MFVGFKALPLGESGPVNGGWRTRYTNVSYYIYSMRTKKKELLLDWSKIFSF